MNLGSACVASFTLYRGFVQYPGGSDAYYVLFNNKQIDNGLYAADDFSLTTSAFCAELLMCYRTDMVWSQNKRVLYLPCFAFPIALTACFALVILDAIGHDFNPQYTAVSATLSILTIGMTWYSTGLICYRLWSVSRQKRATNQINELDPEPSNGVYRKVGGAMIQSGLLYSITQVAFIICFLTDSKSGLIIIAYSNIRIIGIGTALVMLQLHLHRPWATEKRLDNHVQQRRTSSAYSIPVFRAAGTTDITETLDQDSPEVEKSEIEQAEIVANCGQKVASPTQSDNLAIAPSNG
ncbi:hypothetical protein FRB95_005257 [Tulasnella sp. JGI-2019a]|nr:hypothetical protein FRB95_005257 [Tulasnella sp. JGI-2019a]